MNRVFKAIALFVFGMGCASASGLRAPSDLKVEVLGTNAFLLKWKDNSADETGWQILASLGEKSIPVDYDFLAGADRTSYLVSTNDVTGQVMRFQVKAYRGDGAQRVFSKPTSIVSRKAMSKATFETPRNLRASAVDDGRVRVRWEDLSTSESGYFVEIREGSGPWQNLGNTSVEKSYDFTLQGLEPATSYGFRVRAFKAQATVLSKYSNEAVVKTRVFGKPKNLKARNEGEGRISLIWKDNSSLEEGFEVQARTGKRKFKAVGDAGADVTKTNPIELQMAKPYEFRVRAFRTVNGKRVYSGFSNVAKRKSLGLARPADLVVSATTEDSVTLTWKDVSQREEGYTLRYKEKGAKLPKVVKLPAGATTHTVGGLEVGKFYEFQVRTFAGKVVSRYTAAVVGSTRDQLLGNYDVSLTAGVSFLFDVAVTRPDQIEEITASGLPAGLVVNVAERSISGVVATPGVYQAKVKVRFKAGYSVERELTLRVLEQNGGPVVVKQLADVRVARGATRDISVSGTFADSDVSAARRFTTNIGVFDVVLYETAAPKTVANFLAYADGGRYKNTFFHRAPAGFVVQGGGFTFNGGTFGRVSTFAPVVNEPGISNLEGTVAMAKLGGDPNSATSQYFINLSDANAPNLDNQNGGFTVFGRIAGKGMDLFREIDAMPKGRYTISPGGVNIGLDDVPVNTGASAPATLDGSKLVRVTGVGPAPIVAYSAVSLSPGVAKVSLSGNTLRVTGVSPGTARVRVRAEDLDGLVADQIFTVTVP
jgi:cyclophilin family peptidyl-prolyl cis-trans isomerase